MEDYNNKISINLKKATTLLGKVEQMLNNKEYCINIMQQNQAVIGMLKSVHQMLLEKHLKTCFVNAMAAKNENIKKEMIDEILKVTKLANK